MRMTLGRVCLYGRVRKYLERKVKVREVQERMESSMNIQDIPTEIIELIGEVKNITFPR